MFRIACLLIFIPVLLTAQPDSVRLWLSDTVSVQQQVFYKDTVVPQFGRMVAYYDKEFSKKAAEYNFLNSKIYGIYRSYYENGTIMEYGVMSNGKFNGDWTLYDEFGNITIKGKYKMGVKHGYWALRYENCFGRYKNGQKNGTWKCYDNGIMISKIHYKGGQVNKVLYKADTSPEKQ